MSHSLRRLDSDSDGFIVRVDVISQFGSPAVAHLYPLGHEAVEIVLSIGCMRKVQVVRFCKCEVQLAEACERIGSQVFVAAHAVWTRRPERSVLRSDVSRLIGGRYHE